MSEIKHPQSKRYPELLLFRSSEEAKVAFKACQMAQLCTTSYWVGTLCAFLVIVISLSYIRRTFPITNGASGGVIAGLFAGLSVSVLEWLWRNRGRKMLRQRLIDSGVPICLQCGYDIRGQVEARCPECGAAFTDDLLNPK